ncbi:MAG TPA: DUF4388 domain-containing protein [Thermoanaerobaculia bacterium]|jgi:hypothetical protein|nr:DUF4388 domain-containing protein [Thermoanaerobaculia bacterium]
MSFQGSIQELPVPDIIQLVSVSGKTGMFMLVRGPERGYIYLRNGKIVHAELGSLSGEEAVYALAIWSTGDFQFTPGKETESATIERTNTSLLMEAARRLDEWKVLGRKIPGVDAIPVLKPRDVGEPVTLSPPEWNTVMRIDGRRTVEELARATSSNSFDTAKVLYGLVTADLVEMRVRPAEAPKPAATATTAAMPAARPAPPGAAPAPASPGTASAGTPAPGAAMLGDEKKILMILCTRVKQEAEAAMGEANLPGVDRPYKQALAEIDKGRGVEAVRDLIRHTEKAIASIRGPAIMKTFQEKMSLVMQPRI